MTMPDDYLQYPLRKYGMDHDRYDWSMLPRRKKIAWPGGAHVALWVTPLVEWFPLDMKGKPFKPPGAMQTAYPDMRHYTLRDYGNRVGIFRIMKSLAKYGVRASAPMNSAVAERYPSLAKEIVAQGWEVIANGVDMDHLHYAGLPIEEERAQVRKSVDVLRRVTGQPIRGWLSPAKSESFATLDLVAEAGIEYVCDWVNDDMPYEMRAGGKKLHAMPHPSDIDDYVILQASHQTEDDLLNQIVDHFDVLYREAKAEGAGRVMALSIHPWLIGQPYRIGILEEALQHMTGRRGVWAATGAEILDAWRAQQ